MEEVIQPYKQFGKKRKVRGEWGGLCAASQTTKWNERDEEMLAATGRDRACRQT